MASPLRKNPVNIQSYMSSYHHRHLMCHVLAIFHLHKQPASSLSIHSFDEPPLFQNLGEADVSRIQLWCYRLSDPHRGQEYSTFFSQSSSQTRLQSFESFFLEPVTLRPQGFRMLQNHEAARCMKHAPPCFYLTSACSDHVRNVRGRNTFFDCKHFSYELRVERRSPIDTNCMMRSVRPRISMPQTRHRNFESSSVPSGRQFTIS